MLLSVYFVTCSKMICFHARSQFRFTDKQMRLSFASINSWLHVYNQGPQAEDAKDIEEHWWATHGWLEPLLDRVARNYRTVACPVIEAIDEKTLQYKFVSQVLSRVSPSIKLLLWTGSCWHLQLEAWIWLESHHRGAKESARASMGSVQVKSICKS